jgi:hypothetical protein
MATFSVYGLFYELEDNKLLLKYLDDSSSEHDNPGGTERLLKSRYDTFDAKPYFSSMFKVYISRSMMDSDLSDVKGLIGRQVRLTVRPHVRTSPQRSCLLYLVDIYPITDV